MSNINGLCEAELLGTVVQHQPSTSGSSLSLTLKTTERWNGFSHTEFHTVIIVNEKQVEFASQYCRVGSVLLLRGNIRHNSHNKRTDVLVRELRKIR